MAGPCKICGATCADAEFYSGVRTRCKQCHKAAIKQNRADRADYYKAYDRKRYREQDQRKEAARQSAKSDAGVKSRARSAARLRKTNPEKFRARNAVNNAIRDGRLERRPCFFCGSQENLQAHHEDYNHPLDVVWLCAACHGKLHTIRGDFRRESTPV